MSDWSKQEVDLFCEALVHADPAKRSVFLDKACSGRPVLRERVEKLLALCPEADGFFARAELEARREMAS